MANNKMTGIIFSNSHDDALGGLTARRSMGSVPFASRYRLIDLVLSRMSHAGVDSVAVVMQNNYHSLMEHIGSGKEWDLSRKRGGIAYFPPYSSAGSAGYSRGTLESMTGLLGYLQSSSADYIAVSDCDVICGVDLSDVLEYHIAHKAGITLICTEHGHSSVMVSAGEDGRLLEATRGGEGDLMFNNMYIVNRELLIQLVTEAASLNQYSFVDTCLIQKGRELPIYCYRYDGFCRAANSMQAYFEISMRLLDPAVRSTLFPMDRPVYTRVQDEVPVKYGLSAAVSNSLVADGCTPNTETGLKEKGFEFLAEMERLHIIADVSHLSDKGFWDIVEHSTRPFAASHSNCRALAPHCRNLTDEMIRALANKGGLVGLNYCSGFLDNQPEEKLCRSTTALMAKHAAHFKQVGGIEIIGLGSDFDGIGGKLEMDDCSKLPLLADALRREGFTEDEVEAIFYRNARRFFEENL